MLKETIEKIRPVDHTWIERAKKRLNSLTKPVGSLGRLEEFAAQVVAIRQQEMSTLSKKAIFTFAADHGITEEGVSAYPKEVTAQMVFNFLNGGAGINVLSRHAGADVVVVDVGVDYDFGELPEQQSQDPEDLSYLWNNINNGTKIAEAEPNQGDWIEITIPENAIVDTNTLALVLKLKNENMSGYAYGFSTYEYAEKYNEDKPYIEWKVK